MGGGKDPAGPGKKPPAVTAPPAFIYLIVVMMGKVHLRQGRGGSAASPHLIQGSIRKDGARSARRLSRPFSRLLRCRSGWIQMQEIKPSRFACRGGARERLSREVRGGAGFHSFHQLSFFEAGTISEKLCAVFFCPVIILSFDILLRKAQGTLMRRAVDLGN